MRTAIIEEDHKVELSGGEEFITAFIPAVVMETNIGHN